MPVSLLLIIAAPLEALCAALIWRTWGRLQAAESQVYRLRCALAEISCYAEARQQLRNRQQKIEQAVDSTTGSVEAVHRALANFSFDLWGRDASHTRALHDQRAEQVYDTVRNANKSLGRWVGQWLEGDSSKNRDD